ncbi:hypothetical protein L873DRAFT_1192404 [Choiromyces venosus 120613-1]|uniref:Uncharacterized protein n=1 Tax=Choiromyces venosus 120613-1 TaxID=1336337 RepID=A0A3N4JKI8_9PEZI|nr:hypothetical protein L873DRAFT_1192404 [Choiromyces venosus 120613-1]
MSFLKFFFTPTFMKLLIIIWVSLVSQIPISLSCVSGLWLYWAKFELGWPICYRGTPISRLRPLRHLGYHNAET